MAVGQGMVQVYHGDGKGKTTAALGLALRALGAGLRVLLIQFMKEAAYSEHRQLEALAPGLELLTLGKPYFVAWEDEGGEPDLGTGPLVVCSSGGPPVEYARMMREGLQRAREAMEGRTHDLIILDEANVALHYQLLPLEEVLELIAGKPPGVELVFTGRYPPPQLLERADLVTEMREEKHYYERGVKARAGIDC